jgi:hypothetical protein
MFGREVQTGQWQNELEVWLPRILGALAILIVAYVAGARGEVGDFQGRGQDPGAQEAL